MFTYLERNWNLAGALKLSGLCPRKSMYWLLKDYRSLLGRLIMILELRLWVRATLLRLSTPWNSLIISKLA